jgi:hypothetical protein
MPQVSLQDGVLVVLTPEGERFTDIPRPPRDKEAPLLEKLSLTPGSSLSPLRKRNPIALCENLSKPLGQIQGYI